MPSLPILMFLLVKQAASSPVHVFAGSFKNTQNKWIDHSMATFLGNLASVPDPTASKDSLLQAKLDSDLDVLTYRV